MKAAYYDYQGKAKDVLFIGSIPDPEPKHNEVRVKILISGLNPSDIKTRSSFAGAPMEFDRIIPHQDGAGIIDKVGDCISPDRIGERVWLYKAQTGKAFGTAAEYVTLPAEQAVKLPENVSFEVGATLGIPAITAHRCLFADGDIRGKRVLIQGGAGAVGTAAILLAKWSGSWVATTVGSSEQAKVASDAGADLVINRHTDDIVSLIKNATNEQGVDRIVDVDMTTNIKTDIACLTPSGIISAYATENPQAQFSIPFLSTMFGGYVLRFVFFYSIPEDALKLALKDICACITSGSYQPKISQVFSLDQIADAHLTQESGKNIGKILISLRS